MHHVDHEDDAGCDFSTPMTVTIAVDDGPTVRLTYDGHWVRRPFLPHTSVEVRDQPVAAAPHWLPQLLGIAADRLHHRGELGAHVHAGLAQRMVEEPEAVLEDLGDHEVEMGAIDAVPTNPGASYRRK